MNEHSRQMYDFVFTVQAATDKALQLSDGVSSSWYPRSQIVLLRSPKLPALQPGDTVKVMMEYWLAREKRLVG